MRGVSSFEEDTGLFRNAQAECVDTKRINAGDTFTWLYSEPQYPASEGWTVRLYLSLGEAQPIVIDGAAREDNFELKASPASTASWAPGTYRWTLRAIKGEEIKSAMSGTLRVLPDPGSSADRRTHAERMLSTLEAALEQSAGSATVEYEFDGVRVKKDRSELLRMRDRYILELKRQRGIPMVSCLPVRLK